MPGPGEIDKFYLFFKEWFTPAIIYFGPSTALLGTTYYPGPKLPVELFTFNSGLDPDPNPHLGAVLDGEKLYWYCPGPGTIFAEEDSARPFRFDLPKL